MTRLFAYLQEIEHDRINGSPHSAEILHNAGGNLSGFYQDRG